MFIDKVKIIVHGGDGGNGCRSMYRDKYLRQGRPDGGEGGNGGNVILKASKDVWTLLDFKYRHEFKAASGKHGSSNNKRGRNGEDVVALVPQGTQVIDIASNCLLDDLNHDGQELIVAKGGAGGIGNFITKWDATKGKIGEIRHLILDLKLIADVGIVGLPNAGKSTLISRLTSARPKIAPYPFTTLDPVLGVVSIEEKEMSFTLVDIPGLIEGAHKGKGLGDKFLRHIERTKIIVYLIDMAGVDARDPVSDFEILSREIKSYSKDVASKIQIIVANKMDLAEAKENLKEFKAKVKKRPIEISAKDSINLNKLKNEIIKKLQKISS